MKCNAATADSVLHALNNGQFVPYIQPVVSASDLSVSGGELLVRWHTTTGDIIPPAYFIEQVETCGLLPAMTQQLVRQVVSGLACLGTARLKRFRLAVNVTPALLADRDFTQMCLALAGENRIRLVLELTEQRPFCITHRTERILCQLSDAGVEFALDDFGSGYSTLSYLKYFPVSYIKVDKTFIRDVLWEDTSRHIVECVISLAEKIGVRTVAEGVETQAQAKCLQALGIYYFQGYYFGRHQTLTVFRKGVSCD